MLTFRHRFIRNLYEFILNQITTKNIPGDLKQKCTNYQTACQVHNAVITIMMMMMMTLMTLMPLALDHCLMTDLINCQLHISEHSNQHCAVNQMAHHSH